MVSIPSLQFAIKFLGGLLIKFVQAKIWWPTTKMDLVSSGFDKQNAGKLRKNLLFRMMINNLTFIILFRTLILFNKHYCGNHYFLPFSLRLIMISVKWQVLNGWSVPCSLCPGQPCLLLTFMCACLFIPWTASHYSGVRSQCFGVVFQA